MTVFLKSFWAPRSNGVVWVGRFYRQMVGECLKWTFIQRIYASVSIKKFGGGGNSQYRSRDAVSFWRFTSCHSFFFLSIQNGSYSSLNFGSCSIYQGLVVHDADVFTCFKDELDFWYVANIIGCKNMHALSIFAPFCPYLLRRLKLKSFNKFSCTWLWRMRLSLIWAPKPLFQYISHIKNAVPSIWACLI